MIIKTEIEFDFQEKLPHARRIVRNKTHWPFSVEPFPCRGVPRGVGYPRGTLGINLNVYIDYSVLKSLHFISSLTYTWGSDSPCKTCTHPATSLRKIEQSSYFLRVTHPPLTLRSPQDIIIEAAISALNSTAARTRTRLELTSWWCHRRHTTCAQNCVSSIHLC